MYQKTIKLKKGTPSETYTAFCNKAEKDGVFVACGNLDDMWIMVRFDNEMSFKAWIVALSK
jgi:hypothetical protein